MRKSVVKALAFISLLTMIPVSAAYAGNYSNTEYKYGRDYDDDYTGASGYYYVNGSSSLAKMTILNNSGSKKYFYGQTYSYNYATGATVRGAEIKGVINAGSTSVSSVSRNMYSTTVKYVHSASGYAGESHTTYKADSFYYTCDQSS